VLSISPKEKITDFAKNIAYNFSLKHLGTFQNRLFSSGRGNIAYKLVLDFIFEEVSELTVALTSVAR
jgi:hypothetical protein